MRAAQVTRVAATSAKTAYGYNMAIVGAVAQLVKRASSAGVCVLHNAVQIRIVPVNVKAV